MSSDNQKQSIKRYSLSNEFSDVTFTLREVQCLVELLNEAEIKEIAEKLVLHEHTVCFFIRKIICKLKCTTLEEALQKAKQSNLIESNVI